MVTANKGRARTWLKLRKKFKRIPRHNSWWKNHPVYARNYDIYAERIITQATVWRTIFFLRANRKTYSQRWTQNGNWSVIIMKHFILLYAKYIYIAPHSVAILDNIINYFDTIVYADIACEYTVSYNVVYNTRRSKKKEWKSFTYSYYLLGFEFQFFRHSIKIHFRFWAERSCVPTFRYFFVLSVNTFSYRNGWCALTCFTFFDLSGRVNTEA